MKKVDLDCPKCGQNMIKSYEKEAKFRLKLLVWNERGMFAICKSCSGEVEISADLIKSVQSSFVYEIEEKSK